MMKKLTLLCLFTAFLALCGCGNKQPAAPNQQPTPTETEQAAPPVTPEAETETAYQEAIRAYDAVLDQTCDVIYNGYHEENDYPFAAFGVIELSSMERAALLRYLGYTIEDISGDDIPELLIGTIPNDAAEVPETQFFLGGYACKDGEPVCFLEGWARNVYEWLGDGRFFYFASRGYAYSGFGPVHISEDGTELLCEEWYFSETKDDAEIAFYHNRTGVWDKNAAEMLDVDADGFWALSDKYSDERQALALTPFADYPYTGFIAQPLDCKVRVDYFDDVAYQNDYDDASAYMGAGTAYETKLLFRASEDAADFRFLALTLKDVDASGEAAFDLTEAFRVPALRADIPLAVPVNLPETVPFNGFSYTDADGSTKAYSIGVSGRDGSLVVAPLKDAVIQESKETALTAEMALQGVSNYCHEAYDWSAAAENPELMSVTLGKETETEYEVIFRSYTGSYVYFHVDKASGETRMTEVVPTLGIEEDAGSIQIAWEENIVK